jgi:hypothetical protein
MLRKTRIAGVLVGMTMAGVLATGVGQAAAAESSHISLGPYDQFSSCSRNGNQGIEDGEWSDYECVGSAGAWYIDPEY